MTALYAVAVPALCAAVHWITRRIERGGKEEL